MPNIYDYINHSGRAVRDGYRPCYMTRVSAVVCNVTSNIPERFSKTLNFGLDETMKDNLKSVTWLIIMILITISIPVSCWLLAFVLPKGGE